MYSKLLQNKDGTSVEFQIRVDIAFVSIQKFEIEVLEGIRNKLGEETMRDSLMARFSSDIYNYVQEACRGKVQEIAREEFDRIWERYKNEEFQIVENV